MEENQIKSISIELLQQYALQSINKNPIVMHKHCIVSKIDSRNQNDDAKIAFNQPCRIDAMVMWLCLEGGGVLTCNLEELRITKRSLIVLPPKSIVEVSLTEERSFSGYLMVIDQAYLGEADLNLRKIIGTMVGSKIPKSVLHLEEEECQQLTNLFELGYSTIEHTTESTFSEDIIRTMLALFIYQISNLFAIRNELKRGESPASSRTEEYFRRFLKELSEHYLERQNVTFYADQLCISSRYLTTIVRRVSGHSVTDWMNRYVITEAKYLLKYSDMSIQEVAYKLNFPNQSFFGKYFKQHVGISPSTYRQQN